MYLCDSPVSFLWFILSVIDSRHNGQKWRKIDHYEVLENEESGNSNELTFSWKKTSENKSFQYESQTLLFLIGKTKELFRL